MIGESVGNFRVIKRLGQGGMGEVWLAEHKDIHTKVAVKMLLPHISADKQHVERFFNEAVAVSKIKHSGIAKIFDVGFHANGNAYLVMEFLDGEPLSGRISRAGRLPPDQACDVGRQIASVLEATHAEGIVHRDLKPDNIFLVRDAELASGERVKILDFGIAKLAGSKAMTQTDGTMGTPTYMSPEQWKSSAKVDGRADVYSLGCLAFEMVCGRPPFMAETIGHLCTQHLHEAPPSTREIVPDVPPALETLIAKLLSKTADERPAIRDVKKSFGKLHDELPSQGGFQPTLHGDDVAVAVAAPTPPSVVPMTTPAPATPNTTLGGSAMALSIAPSSARSRVPWILAAGLGVVAIGAIAVLAMRGGNSTDTSATAVPTTQVATPASAPQAAAPVVEATTPPTPAPSLAVDASRVTIHTVPEDAEVLLDGTPISNPFDGRFDRTDVRHKIEVRAKGYKGESEWATFAIDRNFKFELMKDVRSAAKAAVAATHPTPVVTKTAPVAAPTPPVPAAPAAASVTVPPPTPTPAAGSAAKKGYQNKDGSLITTFPTE